LLAFKMKQPAACIKLLYPLIKPSAEPTIAASPDYKYVLFCALIGTQVTGDAEKHKAVAQAMLDYSEKTYGKGSPQHKFALAESTAADAGKKSTLKPEVAYAHALDELRQAELMEQNGALLQQMQDRNADAPPKTAGSSIPKEDSQKGQAKTQENVQAHTAGTTLSNQSKPEERAPSVLPYGQ
jgi:hypothetical protein